MSHVAYTLENHVNSWLLMVENQITNLTPNLSFDHNLCFRCPNGQCEPISKIYVSITFQWYKELFKAMSFGPWNCVLNIQKSIGTPTPNTEFTWSVRVHSLTLFGTPGSMWCDSRASSWPATLQAIALVMSPRPGLWYVCVNL
jgi:hypothetical protein